MRKQLLKLSDRKLNAYRRHKVGFVWQQTARNLLPYLTAAENVALPMVVARRAARRERVGELLDLMGVADCADRVPAPSLELCSRISYPGTGFPDVP